MCSFLAHSDTVPRLEKEFALEPLNATTQFNLTRVWQHFSSFFHSYINFNSVSFGFQTAHSSSMDQLAEGQGDGTSHVEASAHAQGKMKTKTGVPKRGKAAL